MGDRILVSLLLVFSYLLAAVAGTGNGDLTALQSLSWKDSIPQSWVGSNPCDGWEGIECTNGRVTSISLPSMDLIGQLHEQIGALSELQKLDLSYNTGLTGLLPRGIGNLTKLKNLWLVGCGFSGPIPEEIGSLQQLEYLSLNDNNFSGRIPPSIGNLSNLTWLDLAHNQLNGTIPISSYDTSGLDQLHKALHFHLGTNRLQGGIPSEIFNSKMILIHVLLERNQLFGGIPDSIGLVQSLQLVRFDNNSLAGHVPRNISSLTNLQELYLSNNELSGPPPDLAGMNNLTCLDMSNNSFAELDFQSWFSSPPPNLTTLKMENTQLQGPIPPSFFGLPSLTTVMLRDNKLNGTLDLGSSYGNKLKLIDLQANSIDSFAQKDRDFKDIAITLQQNPICIESEMHSASYCKDPPNPPDTASTNNCQPPTCSSDQIPSPKCKCANPFTGTLVFRTPSFSNKTQLQEKVMGYFQADHLPVDTVSLRESLSDGQSWDLQVFPLGKVSFNQTEISRISFLLGNNGTGNAFDFYPRGSYAKETDKPVESSKSPEIGIIIGAAVGGSVLLVLLLLAGVYAFRQKRRAERAIEQGNPFAQLDPKESHSGILQSKGARPVSLGARRFSFEELRKYTDNFSPENDIGSGGFGKVYKGTLPGGQLVAIKRAQKESIQGGIQFRAEIELLSRVHHKNLVGLLGFCFERGEQMLVYEFMPKGTLKDAISGKSGIRLDWIRRLKVAVGAGRGLEYLHEHADPPIIHRDIKSNNILLDKHLTAKVADFGLSKLMVDSDKDHITTQVRGTMGYLDPEYYTSQQLTEKSDVYSFGVLMLELVTARNPIEKGKYIVKVVRNAIDKTKELYGLDEVLDPKIVIEPTLKGFEKFVDLAMRCLEETCANRPKMSEVVKEIENILESAGLNPTAESEPSTSASFEDLGKGSANLPYSNESSDSSAVVTLQAIQPK